MRKALPLAMLLAALIGAMPAAAVEIGVVLAGTRMAFWQTMHDGIRRAASDHRVEVVIRSPVDGAALGSQPDIQLRMIEYLLNRKVAGIVLAPEPLQNAPSPIALPVPVVLVDRSSADYEALSTVATDNVGAGQAAARSLANVLAGGAKIAVLRLAPEIRSTTDREEGFISAARDAGWDVVVESYVGFDARDALEKTAEALRGYAGRLDAVFAPNETTGYGALRIVAGMPAGKRPRLVVFDWRREYSEALTSGILDAAVVQDPHRMGYLAVETLLKAVDGHAPPRQRAVAAMVVTRENLGDAAVQAVLSHYGE